MSNYSTQKSDLIQNILKKTEYSRHALPYSDELNSFSPSSRMRQERQSPGISFGGPCPARPKKAAGKGRSVVSRPLLLDHQQADSLRELLAGRLGGRDSLPFSSEFEILRQKFNQATNLALAACSFWRAVCSVCKQPLRVDVEHLLTQAIDSLTNGVDFFNRSSEQGRQASVLIFLEHACEMLLKAGLVQRGCNIRDPASGYTLSFENCLNRGTDDGHLKFLDDDERSTLRVLNGLRDQAQHYLVDVSEQVLYTVAQSTLSLVGKLITRLFGIALAERLPRRVLPLSTDPPRSIRHRNGRGVLAVKETAGESG